MATSTESGRVIDKLSIHEGVTVLLLVTFSDGNLNFMSSAGGSGKFRLF